jgi:hypothetical protein
MYPNHILYRRESCGVELDAQKNDKCILHLGLVSLEQGCLRGDGLYMG